MKYILILCVFIHNIIYCQLTVINPGLEGDPGECFVTPSPWTNCMPYTNFINGLVEFTTPDTQPGCYNINLAPSEGNSYIGFGHIPEYNQINPNIGAEEWQEGFSQELSSPMIANNCSYQFTIDLANGLTADPWNGTNIATTVGEVKVYGGFDFCDEAELIWSSGPIVNENWITYNIEFTPSQNYSHILFKCVKTEDKALCAYILADNISPIINRPPVSYAGDDQLICEFSSVLNANNTLDNETGEWSLISGNATFLDVNDPNSVVTNLSVGENVLQWEVTADCVEESSSDLISIYVYEESISDAGSNQEVCQNFTFLNATSVNLSETGSWNVVLGSGNFEDINDPNTEISNLQIGENTFSWTVTNNICEVENDYVSIFYYESNPISSVGKDIISCQNNVILNGNELNNNESGFWNILSGFGIIENLNEPNTIVSELSIGQNIFQWVVYDECNSDSSEVQVNYQIISSYITELSDFNGNNVSCNGFNDGYININVDGGFPPYEFEWIGPKQFNSNLQNIENLSQGVYTCLITDSQNCQSQINAYITEPEEISLELTKINDLDCFNEAEIIFDIFGGTQPIEIEISTSWGDSIFVNPLTMNNDETVNINYIENNFSQWNGELSITANDANGCNFIIENINVETWSNPIANFEISQNNLAVGELIELTDQSLFEIPILNWNWDFGDGNFSNYQNPTHTYDYNGQYEVCLEITDYNGCKDKKCKFINVFKNHHIYIPNIFTANNDGINDIFLPILYGYNTNTYSLEIFDRWGKSIFYTQNYLIGWDGKYKGKNVTQDVYTYIVICNTKDGESQKVIGKVTLVK